MNDVRRAAGLLGSTLVALLLGGCSGSTPDSFALSALLQTEREFATSARAYGMKVAFLRYLDDDAIVFRPHPVNAKRYTSERPDSGVRLS